jgi:nucleoside-diphosphate-sugar epimerase
VRILVTGATGFIGHRLVQRLIGNGIEVIGLALDDDLADGEAPSAIHQPLWLLDTDLRNAADVAESVAQVQPDRIVHLAAAGVTDPAVDSHAAVKHNVQGTINLLHAAFQNRSLSHAPRQLIVIRTPGETHPANAYTASKAAAWSFCQMYAGRNRWPILGAMIFQAYGPHQAPHTFAQAALRAALAGEDFAMSSGQQRRDWIYIDDVIDGLLAATAVDLPPGSSVDLGTGVGTPLVDVANMAYQLVGHGGAPAPGMIPDRAGEEISKVANVDQTARLLKWKPKTRLLEGLRLVLDSLVD